MLDVDGDGEIDVKITKETDSEGNVKITKEFSGI